jgi:hypothetical protein
MEFFVVSTRQGPSAALQFRLHQLRIGHRRLFLHAKNNLAEPPQGLAFRLGTVVVGEGVVTSCVNWKPQPVTTTADQALAADNESSFALAEAKDFLQALLGNGPVPSKQVHAEAEEAGIAKATLRRARARPQTIQRRDEGRMGLGATQRRSH